MDKPSVSMQALQNFLSTTLLELAIKVLAAIAVKSLKFSLPC